MATFKSQKKLGTELTSFALDLELSHLLWVMTHTLDPVLVG